MPSPTHQTIRLSRGRHTGPDAGACVMELASMLAGEPFSDHPDCASPVIGAFLRAYNDRVDDSRRQALYGYAAKVVGTRAGEEVETARAAMCARWTQLVLERTPALSRRRWRLAMAACRVDSLTPQGLARAAGELAAGLVRDEGDRGEAAVLELLERLISPHAHAALGGLRPATARAHRDGQREPAVPGVR